MAKLGIIVLVLNHNLIFHLILGSVCRRVYRIFSHAYFHHRDIFDEFENQSHLCKRFTVFVTKYNLMSKDNLIVPILEVESVDPVGESEA